MFHHLKDFFDTWAYESAATLKLFGNLTDEALNQRIYSEGRTLGRLANHIIETLSEMPHKLGLPIEEQHFIHQKVHDIVNSYKDASDTLVEALKGNWTDEMLEESTNMYGEMWKNGMTLMVLVTHQIHHRGQMTVLMRQAGLKVPGIYGPSREEWESMGMPALN